jgi:hypothetical protein
MNKDSHLIFEAYKNRPVNENMPYPVFAKLSKHASPKSSKEKSASEFKQQMPDSKEEYSAHDYAKEMEAKGEGEESLQHISKYKHIIDQLAQGAFDTESEQEQVDQGASEGIFDVEVVDGKRQVVLTNAAVEKIEQMYPELKGKFWECGKCKADYAGCGAAKKNHKDENEEGDLMKHMKDKGMIDPRATDDTGKYGRTREEEESRLDPKCWKGYHKAGTKLKGGVRVNNCVKNS